MWLGFGSAGVVVGLVMMVAGLGGLLRSAELTGVPVCASGADDDCLARGPATVRYEVRERWRWLSGERRWLLDVGAVPPQLRGSGDTDRVGVPRQPRQDDIRDGMALTVVYYRDSPVLLELPTGTVLETDEHPRRAAPTTLYLGLATLGLAGFGVRVGWRNGRRRGWWRRVDYEQPKRVGLSLVLFVSGAGGALTQYLAGSSRWPAFIVAATLAVVLGVLVLLAKRRRAVDDRSQLHQA